MNEEIKETKKEVKASNLVTSAKTIDFPSLGWAINAGEIKELPSDKIAREAILNNHFIIKK